MSEEVKETKVEETEKAESTEKKTEEKKKQSFKEWVETHPKTVFWIRFVLWIMCAAVLPFIFIAWRYGIFTSHSEIKLTGWGIIAIIIVVCFAITLVKYLIKGLKPGMVKQCLVGVVAIIVPLTLLYLLITSIEDNVRLFKQALGCVILCEAIGIPLNPFPAWLEKRRKEQGREEAQTLSEIFWDTCFDKKDEHKEGKD